MPTDIQHLRTVAYESVTVSTTSVGLTLARFINTVPAVTGAIISVDTAPIRWRDDGTAPTSSEGHFAIPTGEPIIITHPTRLNNFRTIRQASTDATIRVSYLGF